MGRIKPTQADILCIAAEAGRTLVEGKCDDINEDESRIHTTNHGGNNGGATTGRKIQPKVRKISMSTATTATPPEIGRQQLPQRR